MTDTRPHTFTDAPPGPADGFWPRGGAGEPLDRAGAGDVPPPAEAASSPWRLLALVGMIGLLALAGLPVLVMVLAILVSVLLHEVGHFVAARATGMKATEFFVGFGPKLWSFRRGETEYGAKLVPAGAYVRIIGMHSLEEVPADDEERTYRRQPFWQRLLVVVAGPGMNLLIALLVLIGVYAAAGVPDPTAWSVGGVVEGSGAAEGGLQAGDEVVRIGGTPIETWDDFGAAVRAQAGATVDVVVVRDGAEQTLTVTIGARLSESGAAALPGLYADDVVVGVDGEEASTLAEIEAAFAGRAGETVPVEVQRLVLVDGVATEATGEVDVVVPESLPADALDGFAGVRFESGPARSLGPVDAVTEGTGTFLERVGGTVSGIGQVFSPSSFGSYVERVFSTSPSGETATDEAPVDASALPPPAVVAREQQVEEEGSRFVSIWGIVGIADQLAGSGGDDAQAGDAGPDWVAVALLVSTMNLFLALVNLLPLLPFDGGHATVAIYEAVRGRISRTRHMVDMGKLMPVSYAVFMVFVFIGMSSLYLDIVDPIQLSP